MEGAEGPADPVLSELGLRQARAVGEWLAAEKIDLVISSPLRRALQTAEPIASAHRLQIVVEPDIAEYDRDSSDYIHYEELKASRDPRFQLLVKGDWSEISDEGADFSKRVRAAVDRLIADNPGRRVVAVCHGGVTNVALAHVLELGRDLFCEVAYASVSRVAAARSGPRSIVSINETGHLRDIE